MILRTSTYRLLRKLLLLPQPRGRDLPDVFTTGQFALMRPFRHPAAQDRGAKAMMAVPARLTAAPTRSHLSGETPSTSQRHTSAAPVLRYRPR
jgi:hypothetical protein